MHSGTHQMSSHIKTDFRVDAKTKYSHKCSQNKFTGVPFEEMQPTFCSNSVKSNTQHKCNVVQKLSSSVFMYLCKKGLRFSCDWLCCCITFSWHEQKMFVQRFELHITSSTMIHFIDLHFNSVLFKAFNESYIHQHN